jgi:glycosyltransferase involved in cell wall biosynthesis
MAWPFYSQHHIRENIKRNIQASDLVTCTTPILAEYVSMLNKNVQVVPNFIDADLVIDTPVGRSLPRVFGYQASSTHHRDFEMVEQAVSRTLRKVRDAKFITMGHDYFRARGNSAPRHEHIPWIQSNPKRFYETLDVLGIGIAPLVGKAKDYAARGIPIIASAEAPYLGYIEHGVNGILVKSEHQWFNAIRELLEDDEMRNDLGYSALKKVRENTIQGNIHLWEAAFNS